MMRNKFLRTAGKQAAYGVARRQLEQGGILDLRLGVALLRDRRVPTGTKALAFAVGLGFFLLLQAAEVPVEGMIAVALGVLGVGFDIALNGAEFLVGPLLLTAALLPHVAPKELVARIRAERAGLAPVPVAVAAGR
jgi:hypothetical protein